MGKENSPVGPVTVWPECTREPSSSDARSKTVNPEGTSPPSVPLTTIPDTGPKDWAFPVSGTVNARVSAAAQARMNGTTSFRITLAFQAASDRVNKVS